MKFYWLILIVLWIMNCNLVFCQNKKIDSLLLVLKTEREDTSRTTILNAIAEELLVNKEYEKSMVYAKEAFTLAQKLNFKKGIAAVNRIAGINLTYQGDYREAINNHSAALRLNEQLDNKRGIAQYYQDMGLVYYLQDEDSEALKNYYKALLLFEQINDLPSIQRTLTQIGGTYYYLKNFSEAEKNHLKALEINEQLGNRDGIAYSTKSLAIIWFNQANTAYDAGNKINAGTKYLDAIEKHLAAIKIYKELASKSGFLETYPHLGDIYEKLGAIALEKGDLESSKNNFLLAQKYNFEFLKIAEELSDENYITEACNRLGSIYINLKNYSAAEKFLQRGLKLSVKRKFKVTIRDAYERFSKLDSCKGNFIKALADYKMFILYRDSLGNEEITRKAESYKMQYEFDKKEDSLNQKNIITETKLQVQKKQKYFYWAGLFMLGLLSVFVFLNFRNQKKITSWQVKLMPGRKLKWNCKASRQY